MAAKKRDIDRALALYDLDAKFTFVDRMRRPYRLAYVKKMEVVVHDFRSGRRKALVSDGDRYVACPLAWSSDGRTVFHAHEQLLAIDVRSRKVRELTSFDDEDRFGILWQLHCSPDGSTLLFLHHSRKAEGASWCIYSVRTDGTELRRVGALDNVWSFTCDWPRNELVAQTARGAQTIVRVDLDSGDSRSVINGNLGFNFDLTPDGRRVVYEKEGRIWLASADGAGAAEAIARGSVPSLSPDGSMLAFMCGEDDVYLQRLNGGAPKLLLRARVTPTDDDRRMGSYRKAPLWSPDGKLLCVWSSIGTRFDEPRNAEWVKSLRRREAAYERTRTKVRAKGAIASTKPVHHFAASIESAHWEFEHSVGIVDLEARTVWLTQGYWQDAAWAPVAG